MCEVLNRWLKRALELAEEGRYTCSPNPMVGAVVVRDGEVVGEGYHHCAGEPHAEVNALRNAGDAARGATIYVTLEPCSTLGRTPPCTEAILRAGVSRVVVGAIDPSPAHAGKGLDILKAGGVAVDFADSSACEKLNEKFNFYAVTGMPFVHAKWAMTLDGKIATRTGDAKWISCPESRDYVHRLRAEHDAIMVGIGTVLVDNSRLNVRLEGEWRQPVKVIVDSRCRTPANAAALSGARTIIACGRAAAAEKICALENAGAEVVHVPDPESDRVDLRELLAHLGRESITSVLVEGGGTLLGSLFAERLVNRVTAFVAPKVAGGAEAPSPVGGIGVDNIADALELDDVKVLPCGCDVMISGTLDLSP